MSLSQSAQIFCPGVNEVGVDVGDLGCGADTWRNPDTGGLIVPFCVASVFYIFISENNFHVFVIRKNFPNVPRYLFHTYR